MKAKSTIAVLAEYADVCRRAAKYLDPEERTKAVAEWFGKLPTNQQQLINDLAPYAAKVARMFKERQAAPVLRMPNR